jgi:hypothetical protein
MTWNSLNKRQCNFCFYPGRPNWNSFLQKTIVKAHVSVPSVCGESIGLFFCGSPAIAQDLYTTAEKIPAISSL